MKSKSNINIGVDARTIFVPNPRGTGKNLVDLYSHVARLRPEWKVNLYHEGDQTDVPTPDLLNRPGVARRAASIRGYRFNAWEQFLLPYRALRDRLDILHCPANTCPAWMPVPTVVTIHDLIALDGDDRLGPRQINYSRKSVTRACRKASGIITPSHYTRSRLINEFGADPQSVFVNEWAPDSKIHKIHEDSFSEILCNYGIRPPYAMHFGADAPRKNTELTLRAWSLVDPMVRQTWKLLVIGLSAPALKRFNDLVHSLGVGSEVCLHGFAREDHLPALMSGADILVFASLSEGFGLPILDAWATDTAVITGNRTSLPEVAGPAAVLVDPTDAASIAAGLEGLMKDSALRTGLCGLGKDRLASFTWQKTAERYISVVEELVCKC
jgi:glycosyltransferase involved in cell wall biosynthesis